MNTTMTASPKPTRRKKRAARANTAFWTIEGFVRDEWRMVGVEESLQRACYFASLMVRRDRAMEERVRIVGPEGTVC